MKLWKFSLILVFVCWAVNGFAAYVGLQTYSTTPADPNLRQQNVFGLIGLSWQDPANYNTPGTGNPAVSTADYYHQNGMSWTRPYDLTATACGSTGASIAASRGRYVWVSAPDHPAGYNWAGGSAFVLGYSNDPGVMPDRLETFWSEYTAAQSATVATITATIDNGSGGAGNILTITAVTGVVTYDNHAEVSGTGVTTATITSAGTGIGGTGTYNIGGSAQLVSSRTMTITQSGVVIYQNPQLVCNPDDGTYPFYLYAEASGATIHQQGLIKSTDLITWTGFSVSHATPAYSSWSSYQNVMRDGVNNWRSRGFEFNFQNNGNIYALGKWTSTDGRQFQPGSATINSCIPASSQSGNTVDCNGTNVLKAGQENTPEWTVSSQLWVASALSTFTSNIRTGNQWVARVPLDANYNVIDSPSHVKISAAYAGYYPGPTYLQGVSAYIEDGIVHYWGLNGYHTPSAIYSLVNGAPYINGGTCRQTNPIFTITGSISGTTLTVTATPDLLGVNAQILSGTGLSTQPLITAQLTGGTGGTGTYSLSTSDTVSSTSLTVTTCGGLWQQALNYYSEIVDSSAAAGAAPFGVRASCAASTATITWYNALPQSTYRLYRGTTAGSQTTLVGDFSGSTATDTGMTLNAVTYYKLVYLHSGVEQKNRVVSTYCSTSIALVNQHITRALAAGADSSTINRTWLDTFTDWLSTNSLTNNLLFASMVEFGVTKSGSVISKIFDLGTTRLPRGGDYTTATSGTTYSATGINGNPAWVSAAGTDGGYYGGGKPQQIRRKTQLTVFSAYQKSHTNSIYQFVMGQFSSRIYLSHGSGTPGTISFAFSDATQQKTATVSVSGSATDFHTAAGVFDGTNLYAYSDGTAGSAQTGLVVPSASGLISSDMLTGTSNDNGIPMIILGNDSGIWGKTTGVPTSGYNGAFFNGGAMIVFDKGLSGSQISSLNTLIRTHYGF